MSHIWLSTWTSCGARFGEGPLAPLAPHKSGADKKHRGCEITIGLQSFYTARAFFCFCSTSIVYSRQIKVNEHLIAHNFIPSYHTGYSSKGE